MEFILKYAPVRDGFAWIHVIEISDTAGDGYISKYIDMNILYICKYI